MKYNFDDIQNLISDTYLLELQIINLAEMCFSVSFAKTISSIFSHSVKFLGCNIQVKENKYLNSLKVMLPSYLNCRSNC